MQRKPLTLSQAKSSRDLCYSLCKFVAGAGVFTPLVKQDEFSFLTLLASGIITCALYFFGQILDDKVDDLERLETKCDHITQQTHLHMFD